jgi:diguanylate cyclase (GGDEF)-like protein/PAS domain S-box-containing protein
MSGSFPLSDCQFRSLIQNSSDIITILEIDGTVRYESPSVEQITGYRPEELVGQNIFKYIHPEDLEKVTTQFRKVVQNLGVPYTASFRFHHKGGSWCFLEVTGTNLLDDSSIVGIVINSRDVTERKKIEDSLVRNEAKFRSLIQNSSDVITILNQVLGYEVEELINSIIFEFCYHEDLEVVKDTFDFIIKNPKESITVEFRFWHKDGSWRYLEAIGTNLINDPSVNGIVINSRDVTERKKFEEQLRHNAHHDSLTLLPNRKLFLEWLDHALRKAKRHQNYIFAVLFLDLDRFKIINDSLGHVMGDQLLVELGQRLQSCLRETDKIARFGGDEFAILVEDIHEMHEAIRVAERINEALIQPFSLQEREIFCNASIGIAVSTANYQNPADILRDADTALYRAKERGRTRYEVFDVDMRHHALTFLQLETDLRRALENSEFQLHYQPIVSLETGQITAVETLIRWQPPQQSIISPATFIPVAEETGLINPIGEWVLREACRQMCLWDAAHLFKQPILLNVNVSAKQFNQPDLVKQVDKILLETGLRPSRLSLEITESVLMENPEAATVTFSQLNAMGVQLSMDDFGTGYSSLSYLHRFPIHSLKIDRSFVSRMRGDDQNFEIIRAIITLASNLKINVVAEGVETQEQLLHLKHLQCGYGQGYLFSKPLSAEKIEPILREYFSYANLTANLR